MRLRHHTWEAHELLGGVYWDLNQYSSAYVHYTKALDGKPAGSQGWPRMLNSLCALAIDLGHRAHVPGLLQRLLTHPEAPLAMFFFEADRVARVAGAEAARALLQETMTQHPRVCQDPEFAARATRWGLS